MPLVLAVVAVLQTVLLALAGDRYAVGLGAALAIGTCVVAISGLGRRGVLLMILTSVAVANFGLHLWRATPPLPYRIGHLSIAMLYVALAVAAVAQLLLKVRPARSLLASLSAAFAVIVGEAILERFAPQPSVSVARVVWVGQAGQAHPVLGQYNVPNTVAKTLYPDNARGYFDEERPSSWILDSHDLASVAKLETPSAGVLRVAIASALNPLLYNIQLREPGLRLRENESYELRFRARADLPRDIAFGLSQAHEPWNGLGFYRHLAVDRDWKAFSETFVLPNADANSQLHFDLGGSAESVELENIVLRRVPSGETVQPPAVPTTYSVRYSFNSLGCRGRDYPIPRPPGHTRILALGDSYTLGVGVHESDTFTVRLERSLNAVKGSAPDQEYDVINCGVSGYATREERLFYELIGSKYEPNVVLLSVVSNDDMSFMDEVRKGFAHEPSKLETLLFSTRLIQNARHEGSRQYDYSSSMRELSSLLDDCKASQTRLAVVLFANDAGSPQWKVLRAAINATLANTGVPVVDLGQSLFKERSPKELVVDEIDGHPNEIAHQIAAAEVERFLRSARLIE